MEIIYTKNWIFVNSFMEYVFARVKQEENYDMIEADINTKNIEILNCIYPNNNSLEIEKI